MRSPIVIIFTEEYAKAIGDAQLPAMIEVHMAQLALRLVKQAAPLHESLKKTNVD